MNPTEQKIIKARIALLIQQPFFGQICLSKMQLKEHKGIQTAGVDGKHLFYNPSFIDSLSPDQLQGLLCHEALHLAQMHHTRRQNRDPQKWNLAGDYIINPIVRSANMILPPGGVENPAYKGMFTEKVYSLIPDPPQNNQGQGKNQKQNQQGRNPNGDPQTGYTEPGTGEVFDFPGSQPDQKPTQAEIAEEEQNTKTTIINAAKTAKAQGKLPGGFERLIEELTEAKVPWKEVLRRFLTTNIDKQDYSFRAPNRRYIHTGIILPSLIGETVPPFVVAVDTSGSIRKEELIQFASEIDSILDNYDTTITILYCDAKIQNTEVFTRENRPIRLDAKGGGGTDFRPVFQHVENEGIDPACLVFLTDMYGSFPTQAPYYPVLWVSTSDIKKAPFGEVTQI